MSMASSSSYSTIHHHHHPIPLTTFLSAPHASHRPATTATADPPTIHNHRSATSSINLPTNLITNLLHLSTNNNHNPNTHLNTLPTPTNNSNRKTPTFSPREDISSIYPQIHGNADWSPLLDPLHPWLRREILKYGEFVQATYDAFDFNPFSEYCGSCLYNHSRLFDKLGLTRNCYSVTKYIYAMSHVELPRWLERSIHAGTWSKDSNWMGYVAVSNDEESRRIGCRDIAITWRGTIAPSEWFEDLQGKLESIGDGHGDTKVEHGFLSIYTSKSQTSRYNKSSASEQVMEEIKKLVKFNKEKGEKVSLTVTGHSLGGALALLNAYEAASAIPELPVTVISFGAPRVGNVAFSDRLKELHLVDGHLSSGSGFRASAKRDVALVNKSSGMLREELRIPACWNQSANKGMVCNAYERWVQPQREPEDIPSPLRTRTVPSLDCR